MSNEKFGDFLGALVASKFLKISDAPRKTPSTPNFPLDIQNLKIEIKKFTKWLSANDFMIFLLINDLPENCRHKISPKSFPLF